MKALAIGLGGRSKEGRFREHTREARTQGVTFRELAQESPACCPKAPSYAVSMAAPDSQRAITWAGLLSRWTQFAQASLALPEDDDGVRWRAAVPSIIELQALTHALGELDAIDACERPAALDRAEIALRAHAEKLSSLWASSGGPEPIPELVAELIDDTLAALALAKSLATQWVLGGTEPVDFGHPAELAEMLSVVLGSEPPEGPDDDHELRLASPGIPMMPGAVVAALARPNAGEVDPQAADLVEAWLSGQTGELHRVEGRPMVQVYRQFDFARGGPVRDVIAPACGEVLAGQPLLVVAYSRGAIGSVSLAPRARVDVGCLEVEDELGMWEEG